MKTYFDHEKLQVYQEALRFYEWCEPILERVPKSATVRDQLDRARTSVVLNIPEGKSILKAVVSMLVGLIRSNDPDRMHEELVGYRVREND